MGKCLARAMGDSGAQVVINYRHREKEAQALVAELEEDGRRAIAVRANVAEESEVDSLVAQTVETFGRVDILINNAGISRDGLSWKVSSEDWHEVLNVNLTGTFYATRAVLPHMREARWGRIVNISSVVAQMGVAGAAAYSASKAGIMGLTRTVAIEAAPRNITVNCLALGYFDVGLIDGLSPEAQEKIVDQVPVGQLGKPEAVVETVRYLCLEEVSFVTGQVINVNGGLFMG